MTPMSNPPRPRHALVGIRGFLLVTPLVIVLALCAATAEAQDYTWTVSAMGGVGAALSESGGTEPGFQLGLALQFEPGSNVFLRLGQLDFETGSSVGAVTDGSATYAIVGGEYQFAESFYDSGLFLGLGAYDLESRRILPGDILAPATSDTVLGLALGATGEFKITPNFVFIAEIVGHVLDSDVMRVLGTAHAGLAFHF